MTKGSCITIMTIILCFAICVFQPGALPGETKTMTAAELVAKHISSIGKPEALAQMKSRIITGKSQVQFIQGGGGVLTDGQFGCASEGRNMAMLIKFNDVRYPGEKFAYNGKEVTVDHIQPGVKSPIADFLFRYNIIMKEGLLGGLLSVSWPLLNVQEREAELQYAQEKMADKVYHVLEYGSSKKFRDMKVRLFFDPENYRHVRTEYRVRTKYDMTAMGGVNPGAGPGYKVQETLRTRPDDRDPRATIQESQPDNIFVLIEKFDNFAIVNGLMLPKDYSIEYSQEGHIAAFIAKWVVLVEFFMPNSPVDPGFFVAQK